MERRRMKDEINRKTADGKNKNAKGEGIMI